MSDANRIQIKYVKEVTWGTTPATPTMKVARLVSETFKQDQQSIVSAELRSDRQVSDLIQTNVSASGGMNIEWSSDTYDDFLEWALQSTAWTTPGATYDGSTAAIANITGNVWSITKAGIGTAFPTIGKWLLVASSSHATLNGVVKVVTTAAGVIQVLGFQLSAVASVTNLSLTDLSDVRNGTTFASATIQKQFTDLSNIFAVYTGATPTGFNLDVAPDKVTSGAFNFLCKLESPGTSDLASSTTAATTTSVWNGITNVWVVYDQRAVLAVTAVNMTLNNNLRSRLQIGTLGAISIGSGTVEVTGGFTGYFVDQAQLAKFRNNSVSSFTIVMKDSSGKYYVFDMPRVKFSAGSAVATGINTDILQEVSFTAYLDPTELITLRIAKSA